MKKEKILSFDLIRAICTIGIVLFHYSYNYIEYGIGGTHPWFNKYPNGDWGGLFVAVFFMLSGAVLWYNYEGKLNPVSFYFKRWLSIFPMFYIAWLCAYIAKVNELKSLYWGGPRKLLIYTFLGVDGYFLNPGINMNYYTVGEWFLGAILILYLLFPIMYIIFKYDSVTHYVMRWIATAIIFFAYVGNLYFKWFEMNAGKQIFTCIADFWAGMLIMELKKYIDCKLPQVQKKMIVSAAALLLAVAVMTIPFGIHSVMTSTIVGMLLMIALMYIGQPIMGVRCINVPMTMVSRWSFGIFLVHHVIIYAFMKQFSGTKIYTAGFFGLFIALFAMALAAGGVLSEIGSLISKGIIMLVRSLDFERSNTN